MKVLGMSQDGSAFLVGVADNEVRILDRVTGSVSAVLSNDAGLARGPWEAFYGDEKKVIDRVRSVLMEGDR